MTLRGYVGNDSMGLLSTGSFSVNSFIFFAMTSQVGMTATFDGIIGLSRPYYSANFTTGPLFVQRLKNTSMISRETYSLYVSPTTSYINFGATNSSAIKSGASLVYVTVPWQHMFWGH